jgi:transcriptional regulator with PAS, ATPase and Fis domain
MVMETPDTLKDAISFYERKHIEKILQRTAGNKGMAANIMKISLSSLYRKMDELRMKG